MAGHRDDGTFAEDRAHHPNRKVSKSIYQGMYRALTGKTSTEELNRRNTPDETGLLPSDHVMEAIATAMKNNGLHRL